MFMGVQGEVRRDLRATGIVVIQYNNFIKLANLKLGFHNKTVFFRFNILRKTVKYQQCDK